jgi:hypothetical protein
LLFYPTDEMIFRELQYKVGPSLSFPFPCLNE